jgi:hypothetical protein
MDKSFCFFFQKEVLSSCRCVSLKANWYEPEGRTWLARRGVTEWLSVTANAYRLWRELGGAASGVVQPPAMRPGA